MELGFRTGVFFISTLLLLEFANSTLINRVRSNLILFGGYSFSKDQPSVHYSNSDISNWKNLDKLVIDGGLIQKRLLCGVGDGAWLAYSKADYQYDKMGADFVLLIAGDACVSAENINSVQPVIPLRGNVSGLLTFTQPFFASEGEMVAENATASGVKSLLYFGEDEMSWTIGQGDKKLCVYRPEGLLSPGICIIHDFQITLDIEGEATVTWGCEDTQFPVKDLFQLQTCFGIDGVYKILEDYLQLPVMKSVCKQPETDIDAGTKQGFVKIMDAWTFRMDPDKQDEYNPAKLDKAGTDSKTTLRMRLLTYFFAIFRNGCGTLPSEYFNLLRYIFMQHVKFIWEEAPQVVNAEDKGDEWVFHHDFLESCYNAPMNFTRPIPDEVACMMSPPAESTKPDTETLAVELFLGGESKDAVIEQTWIMLTHVASYCSSVGNFNTNVWVEFVAFFRRRFLHPVLQQWENPGTWRTYYEYMFNGYSLDKGKRQIIQCVQNLIRTTPAADPVGRPSALRSEFTKLSKKLPEVLIQEISRRRKRESKSKHTRKHEKHPTALKAYEQQNLGGGRHTGKKEKKVGKAGRVR